MFVWWHARFVNTRVARGQNRLVTGTHSNLALSVRQAPSVRIISEHTEECVCERLKIFGLEYVLIVEHSTSSPANYMNEINTHNGYTVKKLNLVYEG